MFVTSGQFFVFMACLAFGGCVGVLFSLLKAIKFLIKIRFLGVVLDVFFFIISSFIYVGFSYALKFPNFRVYMVVGVILGIFLYFKSFYLLLAKMSKKIYNIIILKFPRKKKAKNDRRKGEKSNRCKHGRRGAVGSRFNIRDGLADVQNQ